MLHKALQNKWARVLIAVFATFLYALGVNLSSYRWASTPAA